MKKYQFLVLSFILILPFILNSCSGIQTVMTETARQITITDVIENPEMIQVFQTAYEEGTPILIEIPAGTTIPVGINIDNFLMTLNQGENTITFHQDIYLYMDYSSLKISADRINWSDIDNMDAIKTIFGFKQGKIDFGITATEESGTEMIFGLDIVR